MLLTKLHIPKTPDTLVQRTFLYDRLNEGLKRKLVLVSAPAGFGKSVAISDWIRHSKIPAAWFAIDKRDNDPVDFLAYVLHALQTIIKDFGRNILELLTSPNPPNLEAILNLIINEIVVLSEDFVLVLDDFHLIENTKVVQLLAYFLEHSPDNIHLVIITRSDPGIPIARFRSQNQLIELRPDNLNFSLKDISTLFNKRLKIKLSPENIQLLQAKTEGWIAGIQLIALSLQNQDNKTEYISSLTGDNRYIMDYLIEEVLKAQNESVKEFLLKTSILEQFSASLCDELTDGNHSQMILEDLEKANMFLFSLDDEGQWYRYHHLFADLLKQRLSVNYKACIKELHIKACSWFEKNDMHENALKHALDINDFDKSLQLLDKIIEKLWAGGQHAAIQDYATLIPEINQKSNAQFCLYYAWILIAGGQIEKAESYLISAESITEKYINKGKHSTEAIKEQKELLGKIAVATAYLYSHEESNKKIFSSCQKAIELLPEEDLIWRGWAWFSYGIAHFSNGDLHKSKEAFDQAYSYGKKSENLYLISTILIRMAENEQQLGNNTSAYNKCSDLLAFYEKKGFSEITKSDWTFAPLHLIMGATELGWAQLNKAFEKIGIAYTLSKNSKDNYFRIYVLMIYSVILRYLGKSESEAIADELEELITQTTIVPFLSSLYNAWKIYFLLDKGQVEEANAFVINANLALDKEINHSNELAYSAVARVLIAQNKLHEAEAVLKELLLLAESNDSIERIIEMKVSLTRTYKYLGENEKAISCLTETLNIASCEGQLFDFVFWSDDLKSVLTDIYRIQTTQKSKIPKKFLKDLQLAIKNKETRVKFSTESELSTREMDTLKLIAQDLTNQEIANKLFISLNTVKTHLKNINLKLDVDSRAKAITKAKKLQII